MIKAEQFQFTPLWLHLQVFMPVGLLQLTGGVWALNFLLIHQIFVHPPVFKCVLPRWKHYNRSIYKVPCWKDVLVCLAFSGFVMDTGPLLVVCEGPAGSHPSKSSPPDTETHPLHQPFTACSLRMHIKNYTELESAFKNSSSLPALRSVWGRQLLAAGDSGSCWARTLLYEPLCFWLAAAHALQVKFCSSTAIRSAWCCLSPCQRCFILPSWGRMGWGGWLEVLREMLGAGQAAEGTTWMSGHLPIACVSQQGRSTPLCLPSDAGTTHGDVWLSL